MAKDSVQNPLAAKPLKLGHLGTLNQVVVALGKTIRAMAKGDINTQDGSRIANALGIMRQCLETQTLERLEQRMNEIGDRVEGGARQAPTYPTREGSAVQ